MRPRPLPPGLVIGEIYNFTERLNNTPMRGQLITINYNTNIHSFFIPGQMGVFQNHPDFPVLRVQQGGIRQTKKKEERKEVGVKKWTRKYKKVSIVIIQKDFLKNNTVNMAGEKHTEKNNIFSYNIIIYI